MEQAQNYNQRGSLNGNAILPQSDCKKQNEFCKYVWRKAKVNAYNVGR